MKCSKCENEDMAIVSVTVQDGKDDVFLQQSVLCVSELYSSES